MPVKVLALTHAKVLVKQHADKSATGLVKHIVKHIALLAAKIVVKTHALAIVLIRAKVIVRVLQDKKYDRVRKQEAIFQKVCDKGTASDYVIGCPKPDVASKERNTIDRM